MVKAPICSCRDHVSLAVRTVGFREFPEQDMSFPGRETSP